MRSFANYPHKCAEGVAHGIQVSEAMDNINDSVSKIETSQNSLKDNLTESISKLSESTENTNKSISSLKESLKNMVSLNH